MMLERSLYTLLCVLLPMTGDSDGDEASCIVENNLRLIFKLSFLVFRLRYQSLSWSV